VSDRIEKTFAKLRSEKRAALIPFIMGYDPDAATTAALLDALPGAGANIIEIGMPFSDPMADGPVIQAAGKRALATGATVAGILELVRGFRKKHADVPIILMGYFNPVYRYGLPTPERSLSAKAGSLQQSSGFAQAGNEKFCKDAAAAGVDGIILVDLPPEEEQEIRPYLDSSGLKLIRLVAPTSGDARLPLLAKSASGFIYYISVTGITGAKAADTGALKTKIEHLRQFTKLPIAVGFGIKTAAQVKEVSAFSDAVVVGSALVDIIGKAKGKEDIVKSSIEFVRQLANAL